MSDISPTTGEIVEQIGHFCGPFRAAVELLARREGQLRRRPRGRGPVARAACRSSCESARCQPGVPRPGGPAPGRRGRRPAVPRHRHRPAHRRQHPRGRAGDRPGLPGRLRRQRPDGAGARPGAADQHARRAPPTTSTPTSATRTRILAAARRRWTSASRSRSCCSASCNFVIDDDEAHEIVRALMDAVPAGSYLVIVAPDPRGQRRGRRPGPCDLERGAAPPRWPSATPQQITRFFDGLSCSTPAW